MARGLLDLAIARLPLAARQKTRLACALRDEAGLRGLSLHDFAAALSEREGAELFADAPLPPPLPLPLPPLPSKICAAWKQIDGVFKQAEKDALLMERRGLRYLSIADGPYPALLGRIYDPPAVLFYRGNLSALCPDAGSVERPPQALPPQAVPPVPPLAALAALAIVGTRKPCAAAMAWTYQAARELAEAGVCIVSGLAFGIDAQAHRGAVAGGGFTCAVLGSAVDMVFPSANRPLAARIVDAGGALVSEYPPGTPPSKWRFPERNRIISGLCAVTLIAEAPAKSGALITADFALEQNREVWVAAAPAAAETADAAAETAADAAAETADTAADAAKTADAASPAADAAETAAAGPVPYGEGCRRLAFDGAKIITSAARALEGLGLRGNSYRPER